MYPPLSFPTKAFRHAEALKSYAQPAPSAFVNNSSIFLAGALFAASMPSLLGAGSVISTGTGVPPTVLGPYALIPFPVGYDDPRSGFVNDVPAPIGGQVVFSSAMEILPVGAGWGSWSHGFSGDVYAVDLAILNANNQYEVTLSLPPETGAFLFYAEPAFDGLFTITAQLDDGTTLSQDIEGIGGAAGFGFWASIGASLSSISILSDIPNVDFALGEFNIGRAIPFVPESGTAMVGLLAFGLVALPLALRLRR